MLKVSQLSVIFENTKLLDEVDLDVAAGEVVALIGPNGAGKSTLIRSIAGDIKPTAGKIEFHNRPRQNWNNPDLAQHLAVLPQRSTLNFPFTVREVVGLARIPHHSGTKVDQQITEDALAYLDASHLADRLYTQLSGGEQQRVQLARVLAQVWQPAKQPRLLLLDEPSSSFDLAHQQLLMSAIGDFASQGVGILVVLHDLNMAMQCADKIGVLHCGKLEKLGPPSAVLNEALIREVFSADVRFYTDPTTKQHFFGLIKPKGDTNKLLKKNYNQNSK